MLRAEKRSTSAIRFFSLLVITALLHGCTFSLTKTTAGADHEKAPYGAWFLLNPQDMQENLINGCLIICSKAMHEKGRPICKQNGYTLTVMEKNFGYGCADYTSAGHLEFNALDNHWYLISGCSDNEEPEKMMIEREGQQLHVYPSKGKKLVFEPSTLKAIKEKGCLACELTQDHTEHGF